VITPWTPSWLRLVDLTVHVHTVWAPQADAFPFQFQLPPGMPGCFDASVRGRGARAEKDHAYIQYRVTSECDVAGMFNSNMKHTQYLVVQQRLMQPIIQVRLEATENVTACCCFGKGQAHLSAHLDKSAYVPGENIGILAEITNQSEEAFGNVRVELRRRMTIRANGGETQTTDVRVATSGYGGVGKGEVRVGANALPLPLGLPTDISPSTQGRLIHCEYYVDVVFVASSAIVRNLHVKVPVSIYAPPPPAVEFMTQLPPGWHGQQMGMTQVQLPAAAGSPPGPPLAGSPPGPPQQYGGAAAAPSPYGGAPPTATTPLLAGGDGGYGGVPQQPGYQQPYGAPPPSAPYSGQYGAPVVQQQPQ